MISLFTFTSQSRPAISVLTELELFSIVAREAREAGIDRNDGGRIIAEFLSYLDSRYYTRLPIEERHYRLARDWIGQFTAPIRCFDAIHLAIASPERAVIITSDEGLAKSAEALAVDAVLLRPDI